jgi:catechol 2,3-dioxygenase-like lactoylglutathione lyase family enzyme
MASKSDDKERIVRWALEKLKLTNMKAPCGLGKELGQKERVKMILENCDVMAFVATAQPEQAREFYCDTLGLLLEEDNPSALIVKAANATLRIQKVQAFTPLPFTTLGWKVSDIEVTMKQLLNKGVKFQHYEGMSQDELGIWISPSGARVCWFKDPDGNVLSLTQFT